MQMLKTRVKAMVSPLQSAPMPSRSEGYRIRGRQLQRIRLAHFLRYPLCVICESVGRVSAAVVLDHRIALTNGGTDTDDNRQGLCEACHLVKTRGDLAGGGIGSAR